MFPVHVGRASPLARFLRVVWVILGPTVLLALMVVIAWQPGYVSAAGGWLVAHALRSGQ